MLSEMMRYIESPHNPTLKYLQSLHKKRNRDQEGCFVIEGLREVSRAFAGGIQFRGFFICSEFLAPARDASEVELLAQLKVHPQVNELSKVAFEKISYREHPDGMLALAELPKNQLEDLRLSAIPLILVLDALEKPGNIGALLRTADSVGVDAVIITGEGADLYNPNVIRASMGSLFALKVLEASETILQAWLSQRGIALVAASPEANKRFWDYDFRGPVALLLGTEHEGLDTTWLKAAHECVHIPMSGSADSLNVATSGAVLLYEAFRQRTIG